VVRALQHASPA